MTFNDFAAQCFTNAVDTKEWIPCCDGNFDEFMDCFGTTMRTVWEFEIGPTIADHHRAAIAFVRCYV